MILRDEDIKEYGDKLIDEGYNEKCVESISYRITINGIITKDEDGKKTTKSEYTLRSLDTFYVKSNEHITLPNNMTARIVERNSMMRKGLFVSGPHYQPGHSTYIFLRVKNLTGEDFILKKSSDPREAIAQIEFEKLEKAVADPYGTRDNYYQDEDNFIGEVNEGLSKKVSRLVENTDKLAGDLEGLRNKQEKLYSEIITLMGIFVAIFSLIITNMSSLGQLVKSNIWSFMIINASLGLTISCLIVLLMAFIDKTKNIKIVCVIAIFFLILLIISVG